MAFNATRNTIAGTLGFCSAFIGNRPSTFVAGAYQEPALTGANLILSTILSPPFAWQWNRTTTPFNLVAGQSDYLVSLPDFGWLEKATIENAATPSGQLSSAIYELQIATCLAAGSKKNRPSQISVQYDDNAGNITFRFLPVPDVAYSAVLTYQKAAPLVTSLYATPLSISSVSNASNGTTVYTGTITGGASNAFAGQYFQAGTQGQSFAKNANNGVFLCTASSATSITLQNPNGVSDTTGAVALATTWAPLPDKYNFLYERAMSAQLHKMYDSAMYAMELQIFFRQLVGISEGLSETAKAIFLEDRLAQIRTEAAVVAANTASPKQRII